MNSADYDTFRTSVEDIFAALYMLDVGSLTSDQRLQHQKALSAAYLAVIRIENKQFADLTADALQKLVPLSASTAALQAQLVGLKKAADTLQIVSGALDVLTAIVKLLK